MKDKELDLEAMMIFVSMSPEQRKAIMEKLKTVVQEGKAGGA